MKSREHFGPKGHRLSRLFTVLIAFVIAVGISLRWDQSARAAANLTILPLTWNVVGLDSNNVAVGPNNFPIGARVCNVGDTAAANVTPTFVWDTTDAYINLRPGSYGTPGNPYPPLASLAAGDCHDFYFEVEITRNASAYNHTARYHITVTADGLTPISTPTPREIFVEHLISQSRNATVNMKLNGVSIPAGGTMALIVGGTYNIELVGATATNGYEQIETFINFSNTVFHINSVATTYSAYPTPHTDPNWATKLYANGCNWENDPNSPNYRSCWSTGKYGGNITVSYNITIIGGGGTSQTLTSLIYDFSGSSYHYNADYAVGARVAAIIDPSNVTIAKAFKPAVTGAGGTSTLTFTLTNPNAAPLTDVNFTDTFPTSPGAMVVATPATYSTSGCGTPTFAPLAGAGSISFANGTIPANGSCVINVSVTVPAVGTYNNTSGALYIGTVNTGNTASASLTVTSAPPLPACTPNLELARWTMETSQGTTLPPVPSFLSGRVPTAVAAFNNGTSNNIYTGPQLGTQPLNYWNGIGWAVSTALPNPNTDASFQFTLDTHNFSGVRIAFLAYPETGWANPNNNGMYVFSSIDDWATNNNIYGATNLARGTWNNYGPIAAAATGTSTSFRVIANGRSNGNPNANLQLDNIVFTGCGVPYPPAITKSFSPNPIGVNGISTLTFYLNNENNVPLTGVRFTDNLPAGLQVAATPAAATTCGGAWSPAAGNTTLTFTGGVIPARVGLTYGTCTLSVNVTATTGGPHQNVSGFIYTSESYTNTTSTGSATASLTAVLPPQIAKRFAPNPIVVGGVSSLTFTIINPNPDFPLSGVAFTDLLPAGVTVSGAPVTPQCGGGSVTVTNIGGRDQIALTGGSLTAAGSCTVTVNTTASVIGNYANTTGNVSANAAGNGNTASDTLTVTDVHPGISILKRVSTSPSGPWTTFVGVPEGADVYYQFTVENIGDVALASVTVTDPTLVPSAPNLVPGCSWASMPLYDVQTCTLGPVTAVSGWNNNTATAHGWYPNTSGTEYTDASTASYATTDLTLVKTALESAFTGAGDVLHYRYQVTNTGAAPLAEPVTVSDDKSSDETCPSTTTIGDGDAFLDPGESITCQATYTVVPADVTAGFVTNLASASANGVTSNTDSETVNQAAADYGDLPSIFGNTLQSANGPHHTLGGLFLGASISADSDGQESANAGADAGDDGIARETADHWTAGQNVRIYAMVNGNGGYLVGWIDWNYDNDFADPDERIVFGNVANGMNTLQVTVPSGFTPSADDLFVRFRLYDGNPGTPSPLGLANNGEVEDYRWLFSPTAVTLSQFTAQPSRSASWWLFAATLLLGVGLLAWRLITHRTRRAVARG